MESYDTVGEDLSRERVERSGKEESPRPLVNGYGLSLMSPALSHLSHRGADAGALLSRSPADGPRAR
jgi:hypothetical protein